MEEATDRRSPPVRTADLLPPPPMTRALAFAGVAAAIGAAAWGLLAFYAHSEFGILAWGIGVLVGAAVVRSGGHGTLLAVTAGALALLSIVAGKQMAFRLALDQNLTKIVGKLGEDQLAERKQDAKDWVALGPSPTTDQVREFVRAHGYRDVDATTFGKDEGARLRAFAEKPLSLDDWRDQIRSSAAADASFLEFLKDDAHPLDFVFALLGIATAFGMVQKATIAKQVAARQAMRAEREAGEQNGDPAS
ncbi:MAG: hypothetical protein JNK78_18985 [Planctomycetes bacterium]|nr:hypothetical protein [Planctomycetota bacterium]